MTKRIIILSDVDNYITRLYALDLHQLFLRNDYQSQIVRINPDLTTQRVYSQKDTLFITLGEIPRVLPVDQTSRLVFIPHAQLSIDGINTARKSHVVIAHSMHAAHLICNDLQSGDCQTPVCYLPAFIDLSQYQFQKCFPRSQHIARGYDFGEELPQWYSNLDEAFLFPGNDVTWHNKARLYLHINDKPLFWDRFIYVAMAAGIPVIAEDRECHSEFIIDGYNGHLIEHRDDAIDTIKRFDDINFYDTVAINARAIIGRLCEETQYITKLNGISWNLAGQNLNHPIKRLKVPEKEWIVRDRHLKDGKLIFWPIRYRDSLNELRSNDILDILRALSNGQFKDVYIFGVDYGDDDIYTINRVKLIIKSLGQKARNIHFCMEENNIPIHWKRIFEAMSIIPLREGLRQIQQN